MQLSVVVPTYNAATSVLSCVRAACRSLEDVVDSELIVVDNGSTDATLDELADEPGIVLLEEATPSSYAARNRGARHSRGLVIAFTDADCRPAADWARQGLDALQRGGASIVAGRVVFELSDPRSPWQLYDAMYHLDNEAAAASGAARTANVFVRRHVLDAIGPFDPTATSGEDVAWTRRAVAAGFSLAYCADVVVRHPARDAGELLRKALRTGGAAPRTGASRFPSLPSFVIGPLFLVRSIAPPNPRSLARRLRARVDDPGPALLARVYMVCYALQITRGVGLVTRRKRAPRR